VESFFPIVRTDTYEFHNMGLFAPNVVILDDHFETIAPHKEYLLKKYISTLITNDHNIAIEAYKQNGNTAAYALDNHMNKIKRIGTRDTAKGLAVGLAVISHLTNDGQENNIKHCATISGYPTEAGVQQLYDVLEENGQDVKKIDKDNFEDFIDFVETYRKDFHDNIEYELISKNVIAVRKTYGELSKSEMPEAEIATMMGFPRDDQRKWLSNENSIIRNSGIDIKERIEALAYIKHGLLLHFDNNIADQSAWLHETRSDLGGSSPWGVLISGNLTDIYMVASLVNSVLG
jgi:hypothetical protein